MSNEHKKKPRKLATWTTHTSRLLEAGEALAWDVLDRAFEPSFSDKLVKEIEATGWMKTLRPARTTGDAQMIDLLKILEKQPFFSSTVPQKVERTSTARGDASMFVTRDYRGKPTFRTKHPCLHRLIESVEVSVQQQLKNVSIDASLTSVQLAIYPGDGKSGYLRHCDRAGMGQDCQQEEELSDNKALRIITAIYYLTPQDWDEELDGGCLRLFESNEEHIDVVPYSNRLVVFRSDGVSHQVMPSKRRQRMAITVWLSGFVKEERRVSIPILYPQQLSTNEKKPSRQPDVLNGPPALPILDNDVDVAKTATIFVSIASYRDSELGPTLRSIMKMAQNSSRVFVCVVLQIDTRQAESNKDTNILKSLPFEEAWFSSQVRFLTLDARQAQGPCYARNLCRELHRDEEYVLQIDSHMRFRPNWDSYLIQQLLSLNDSKAMLTTYPVGYHLPNIIPNEVRGTLLVPWKFDNDGMLRQQGKLFKQSTDKCIPCLLYAAGFNFSRSAVLQDVGYDGSLKHLFFGEEMSMAVRLYTHGHNLYAPPQTVCFHLWSRAHRPPPLAIEQKKQSREASLRVVREQLNGSGPGLGTVRSVADFSRALNVDFESLTIGPNAYLGGLAPEDFDSSPLSQSESSGDTVQALHPKAQSIIASFLGV